jgi:hypothetical protein
MIKEVVTETKIVDLDNYPEELEKLEEALDQKLRLIYYKVYRLQTYEIDLIKKVATCVWLIMPNKKTPPELPKTTKPINQIGR